VQGYEGVASLYIKGAGLALTGMSRQESSEMPHVVPLQRREIVGNLGINSGNVPASVVGEYYCSKDKTDARGHRSCYLAAYCAFALAP